MRPGRAGPFLQDTEFIRAYRVLSALPENATAEEFRGPEAEKAALALGMR
jgi:hypothetical protein